jgi:hypothetical protein
VEVRFKTVIHLLCVTPELSVVNRRPASSGCAGGVGLNLLMQDRVSSRIAVTLPDSWWGLKLGEEHNGPGAFPNRKEACEISRDERCFCEGRWLWAALVSSWSLLWRLIRSGFLLFGTDCSSSPGRCIARPLRERWRGEMDVVLITPYKVGQSHQGRDSYYEELRLRWSTKLIW